MTNNHENSKFVKDEELIEKKEKNTLDIIEQVEKTSTNVIFSVMILTTIIGAIIIVFKINQFLIPYKKLNRDYEFPSILDFKITLCFIPVVIVKN